MDNNGEVIKITKHNIVGLFTTGNELTLELLYEIANPYGFRDLDWMDYKLYSDPDLEERINQIEILKDHKEKFRKRREKFKQKVRIVVWKLLIKKNI